MVSGVIGVVGIVLIVSVVGVVVAGVDRGWSGATTLQTAHILGEVVIETAFVGTFPVSRAERHRVTVVDTLPVPSVLVVGVAVVVTRVIAIAILRTMVGVQVVILVAAVRRRGLLVVGLAASHACTGWAVLSTICAGPREHLFLDGNCAGGGEGAAETGDSALEVGEAA